MSDKELNLQEKCNLIEKEYKELLKKYNLELVITIDFPEYRILPVEIQLAQAVLAKHRVTYTISYMEGNRNENKK